MAIAHDATSTSITTSFGAGPVTKTWTHTCTGSNLLLVLDADIWQDVGGTGTITAASYNGVALTKIDQRVSTAMSAEQWYLKAPATGANTMSVTVTGATDAIKLAASSFTGVDQTSPLDNHNFATGSSGNPAASVTTLTANALVVATLSRFSTTAATTNQTSVLNNVAGTTLAAVSYQLATTTGSYTDTYTGTANQDWAMIISSFIPATTAAGGGYIPVRLPNRFVGPMALRRNFRQPYVPVQPTSINYLSSLASGLTFVGSQTKATARNHTGSLSFVGALRRATSRSLSAGLTFAGTIARVTARRVTGSLSFTGSLIWGVIRQVALSAALTLTGAMTRQTQKRLSGGVSFSGSLGKAIQRAIGASLAFTAGLSKQSAKLVGASLSFAGGISRTIQKGLGSSLSFIGEIARHMTAHFTAWVINLTSTSQTGSIADGASTVSLADTDVDASIETPTSETSIADSSNEASIDTPSTDAEV